MKSGQLKTIALVSAALAFAFASAPHAKSQQDETKPAPAQQQSTPSATAQSSATMDGMQMGENQQRTAQNSDNMQQEIAKNPDAAQAAHQAMSGQMSGGMSDDDDMHMDMGPHMHMTDLRPANAADQKRAAEIVATVRQSISKYKDYNVALDDGFKIFGPNVPQKIYHFTNYRYAVKAQFTFDAEHPTSLLYRKTAELRAGRRDVHGAAALHGSAVGRTRAAQRGALARAREFLFAAARFAYSRRELEAVRAARLDRDRRRVQGRRRALVPHRVRLDGPRVSVPDRPREGLGALSEKKLRGW